MGNYLIVALLIGVLLAGCRPTAGQPPVGDRFLGTFEASGPDYREVIRIFENHGVVFEHSFFRNSVLVFSEKGTVLVEGYSVTLSGFTEFINSETEQPLTKELKYASYPFVLLREGEPDLDRLLPFAEHPYNLQKVPNKTQLHKSDRAGGSEA